VAIATTIAGALAFDTGLQIRRAEGAHARSTAWAVAGGTEALAAQALAEQLKVPEESIHAGQRWAAPLGPLPLTAQSSVRAQLVDLQGRFNLNRLVDASGHANPEAVEAFERLLVALELEPQWAPQFADWIKNSANLPVTSTTELLALPGFGTERFIRLAPHVAALPRDANVNLCTASGAVLDALANERQWRDAEEALARARARGCFPTREIFRTTLGTAGRFESLNRAVGLAESSRHFRLVTNVRVGTIEHTLYSLLRVETSVGATPRVRLLTRSANE